MRVKDYQGKSGRPRANEMGRVPQPTILAVGGLKNQGLSWGIISNALRGVDYHILRAAGAPAGSGRRGCWVNYQTLASVMKKPTKRVEITYFAKIYCRIADAMGLNTGPMVDPDALFAAWETFMVSLKEPTIKITSAWLCARSLHQKEIAWHTCGRCKTEHLVLKRVYRTDDPPEIRIPTLPCPMCDVRATLRGEKINSDDSGERRAGAAARTSTAGSRSVPMAAWKNDGPAAALSKARWKLQTEEAGAV